MRSYPLLRDRFVSCSNGTQSNTACKTTSFMHLKVMKLLRSSGNREVDQDKTFRPQMTVLNIRIRPKSFGVVKSHSGGPHLIKFQLKMILCPTTSVAKSTIYTYSSVWLWYMHFRVISSYGLKYMDLFHHHIRWSRTREHRLTIFLKTMSNLNFVWPPFI